MAILMGRPRTVPLGPPPRIGTRHEPHRPDRPRKPSRRRAGLRTRRHPQGARPGRGGQPRAGAGLPGCGHPASGFGRARDVHRPQDQLRGRRGAHLPGPLADHRQDRGRHPRSGAPGQAVLPAGAHRKGRQDQGEADGPLAPVEPGATMSVEVGTTQAGPEPSGLPAFAVSRSTSMSGTREVAILLVVAAAVAFVVKALVAQAFFTPPPSMVPQLEVHDRVVVSRLAYHLHDPRRGDIVVFDAPPGEETERPPAHELLPVRLARDLGEGVGLLEPRRTEFIKRVIGLPGDTVEGRGGVVFVNGHQLLEPYLPPGVQTSEFPAQVVPPHTLWVMGDNRGDSVDSRRFGPIPRKTVIGRTVLKIWPLSSTSFL